MMHSEKSEQDWVDLLLLAAIGVLSTVFLAAVHRMLEEPQVRLMHLHFLWRWPWIVTALVVLVFLIGIRVWMRPKGHRTAQKRRWIRGLDLLLLLNIAVLPMLLFWPPPELGNDPPRPGAQVRQQYVMHEDSDPEATTLVNYLLYLPPEYQASRKWPLVVYLHGSGGIGDNLVYVRSEGLSKQIEQGRQFPFIVVSPQCRGIFSRGWDPKMVIELIDHVSSTLSVDRARVYLTGNSMGGYGTWEVASHYPDRFAAIVPLCGGGETWLAKRLVNMPVWAFHGAKDDTVPLAAGQKMVDAVKECGGHVKFTVYSDLGHEIDVVTYQNDQLYEWLLAQRRGPAQERSPAAAKEASATPSPSGKK